MTQNYSVSLEKIIAAHNLEIIYLPKPAIRIISMPIGFRF